MLGRFLFRWRGVIGFLAFGVVFWLARPTFGSCSLGVPLLLAGLAVRFWASGYIGIAGRVREIGGQREERGVRREGREARSEERGVRREEDGGQRRRIVGGPYRILRHPLYIGNFLLVVGMLAALRPAVWLAVVVLVGFIVEYTLIVAAEEKDLACRRIQNPESRVQNPEVRTNRQSPESMYEKQGTVPGSRTRPCEGTVPVFRQRPESFVLGCALVEWRTWVVTGVAWGLAVAKAAVRS